MELREMALTANEGQQFDVEHNNEWHELTREGILADADLGTRSVTSWFPSASEPGVTVVTCGASYAEFGWMILTEAADALGVTRQRVHQLLGEGKLDGRKVGNAWVVERESVENRLEK